MKSNIVLILTIVMLLASCITDDPGNPGREYKSSGSITGYDMRECACCGGWFINIGGERYRFQSLPAGSSLILDHAQFPIEVLLDWEKVEKPCLGDEINVIRIKKK